MIKKHAAQSEMTGEMIEDLWDLIGRLYGSLGPEEREVFRQRMAEAFPGARR